MQENWKSNIFTGWNQNNNNNLKKVFHVTKAHMLSPLLIQYHLLDHMGYCL